MKIRPILFSAPMVNAMLEGRKTQTRRLITSPLSRCEPGDWLWVRETHYVWLAGYKDGTGKHISYRATDPDAPTTWTPSLHMPRFASRLSLQVTECRIQKLHWISKDDAIAEGIQRSHGAMWCGGPHRVHGEPTQWYTPQQAYADLWDSLHGSGSWQKNPDVIAISFRVHHRNIDSCQADKAGQKEIAV